MTKTKRITSSFDLFWETRGKELAAHFNITGEDVREFARISWNAATGIITDHARAAVNEVWRNHAEPLNQPIKRGKDKDEPESADYMDKGPDVCGNEAKPVAIQTDLTGQDEAIDRDTIKGLFD